MPVRGFALLLLWEQEGILSSLPQAAGGQVVVG